jgi:hypothetical protein
MAKRRLPARKSSTRWRVAKKPGAKAAAILKA